MECSGRFRTNKKSVFAKKIVVRLPDTEFATFHCADPRWDYGWALK